jgi:hypothetical protein
VPVLDLVLAPPTQPRQFLDAPLRVPHLDTLRIQPRLDLLADQTAGYRVGVPLDVNRATGVHPHPPPFARLQPSRGQRPQHGQLLRQTPLPPRVALLEQLTQERLVATAAGEVPAATQQQRLLQATLELAVALLDVAVLVALARLDGLRLQAVVPQQRLVALLERRRARNARLNGRRQPIGAMHLRHTAEFPQGVLQPLAEALVALGEAEGAGLPVGVRQHEVVDQVLEQRTVDGHAQLGAVREVAGTQPAGVMHLGEEHLLGRPGQGAPATDTPLQGAELPVGKAAGVASLQILEQGLGLQGGVEAKQLFQLWPDLGERVRPGAPVMGHAADLTRQPSQAAVLAGRLGIDADAKSGLLLGNALTLQTKERPDLPIGDHREPPVGRSPMVYSCSQTGNSNCR